MATPEIITGLDIGSGRVTCVMAACDEETGRIKILGGAAAESKGLKGGMVTSVQEAAYSIRQAVQDAEKASGQVCSGVIVGVRGAHIHSFDARGRHSISRTDQTITEEDVLAVLENSRAVRLEHGACILHTVPQKFSLDRLPGVPNPIGMQGGVLEVETHMVQASAAALTNLASAVKAAGLSLDYEPVYTPLALGELLVAEEERELGTLLVDLGGQTTSLAIYAEGALHYTRELPVGGDHITRDLAHGLGTTTSVARELKHSHGAAYSALVDKNEKVTVLKADRRTRKEVPAAQLLDYVQPRLDEILEMIYNEVQKSPYGADLAGGAVLTGGGSLLRGLPEAAQELLLLQQARLAYPVQEILDCPEEYQGQQWLGAVALTCYPHLKHWMADLDEGGRGGGLLRQALAWLRDLF
jgi:cell division protein FtsA